MVEGQQPVLDAQLLDRMRLPVGGRDGPDRVEVLVDETTEGRLDLLGGAERRGRLQLVGDLEAASVVDDRLAPGARKLHNPRVAVEAFVGEDGGRKLLSRSLQPVGPGQPRHDPLDGRLILPGAVLHLPISVVGGRATSPRDLPAAGTSLDSLGIGVS